MVGYGHQGEEAVIFVIYFKIICAIGVERRDKGSALFHIIAFEVSYVTMITSDPGGLLK